MLQTKTLTTISETDCYFEKVISSNNNGNCRSFLHNRSSRTSRALPDSVVAQAGDVDTLRPESVEKEDIDNFSDYDDNLDENDNQIVEFTKQKVNSTSDSTTYSFKKEEIIWKNVLLIGAIHISAAYSLYAFIIGAIKWQNMFIAFVFGAFSAFGITVGAHRLWAHRSFKAKWPLR